MLPVNCVAPGWVVVQQVLTVVLLDGLWCNRLTVVLLDLLWCSGWVAVLLVNWRVLVLLNQILEYSDLVLLEGCGAAG